MTNNFYKLYELAHLSVGQTEELLKKSGNNQ
jgi:hypothetical protein